MKDLILDQDIRSAITAGGIILGLVPASWAKAKLDDRRFRAAETRRVAMMERVKARRAASPHRALDYREALS